MRLGKFLEVPTPNIMCGRMIWKRGRVGHILGSSYTVGTILRSIYADHNVLSYDGRGGGGGKSCLGY